MKKRIAIVTLNGYFNYGNRLQNLALQEILKELGYEVETLRINRDEKKGIRDKIRNFSIGKLLRKIRDKFNKTVYKTSISSRERSFINFSNEYIDESESLIDSTTDFSVIDQSFDFFVIGSDQVWNPSMNKRMSLFFLPLIQPNRKVAYAASFGVDSLNEDDSELYKEYLHNFEKISVREKAGVKLVKNLVNKDALVTLDPTLVLNKTTWKKLALKCQFNTQLIKEKYILLYFLGKIPMELNLSIETFARKHELKIYRLNPDNSVSSQSDLANKRVFSASPLDFLSLVNNSSFFLTDSFHGTVFSIIFEKKFNVFKRFGHNDDMSSRLVNLSEIIGVPNLINTSFNVDEDCLFNYADIHSRLNKEIETSMNYLRNSLEKEKM